jgi:chromosome segregation ATPase
MSNDFGFDDSGSWAGAGLALGAGILQGRIDERRHQETLAAIGDSARTRIYIADLQKEYMDGLASLLQAELKIKRKDKHIAHLNAVIADCQRTEAQRLETIATLRDALAKHLASSKSLIAHKDEKIESDRVKILRNDKRLSELDRQIRRDAALLDACAKQIAVFKANEEFFEKQLALQERRVNRLRQMVDNADLSGRRWKDKCYVMGAQRDEYHSRLVRIAGGEVLEFPAALAAEAGASLVEKPPLNCNASTNVATPDAPNATPSDPSRHTEK